MFGELDGAIASPFTSIAPYEPSLRHSPRNAGVVMKTSAVWPLQIQGSLQMYTSLRRNEAVEEHEPRHRPRSEMRLKPSRGID